MKIFGLYVFCYLAVGIVLDIILMYLNKSKNEVRGAFWRSVLRIPALIFIILYLLQ